VRGVWFGVAALAVALTLVASASAAGSQTYFSGSLINGSYATSAYDNAAGFCGYWYANAMFKPSWAGGIVAAIDASGTWRYSFSGSGNIALDLSHVGYAWTKKLLCKSNMSG
jgi:hypothetical protein